MSKLNLQPIIRNVSTDKHDAGNWKQREEYPVYRLVDINRTEIPVVLRNLGSVRRAYPVTPVTYGLVHGNPRLRLAQLIQLRLTDVLVNTLAYGILPPLRLEEHL